MRMRNYATHTFKSDAFVYLTIQKCSYSKYLSRSFQWHLINFGPSTRYRWCRCRPCLLVWLGHLLRVHIRVGARFFGAGVQYIRYVLSREKPDQFLSGDCQWFARLSRALSQLDISRLPTRGIVPAALSLRQDSHEHAAQGRWRTIKYVAQHIFGVTLVVKDIEDNKRRIYLTLKSEREREMGLESAPSRPFRDIHEPLISPHKLLPVRCTDIDRWVRPLRWAPSTSSPFAAGQSLHGGFPHNSSVQALSEFPGGSFTWSIRREPGSSRVSWRWSEEMRQRGEEEFFSISISPPWDRYP